MTERPASWRMPIRKQMEAMARTVGRKAPPAHGLAPGDDLPLECWHALLTAPADEALKRHRPLPDGALRIVARGVKEDPSPAP